MVALILQTKFMSVKGTPTPEPGKVSHDNPLCPVSSTPMEPKKQLEVTDLFQKMGSKLGWFEYKDLDSAMNSVIKNLIHVTRFYYALFLPHLFNI